MLAGNSIGVLAQLPYNTTMTESHFNDSKVIVASNKASWNNGVELKGGNFNWDDKYIVIALNRQSIPYQLKFKYKVSSWAATNPNWYVDESEDNSNWSRVWSNESKNTSWSDEQTLTLTKSTKYIKLCYSGNLTGTYADIRVSDQSYVHDPIVNEEAISSLDFGSGAISSGKSELSFEVEWCNVEPLTVSSSNPAFFTVTPPSFGRKASYGTEVITVAYNRDNEVNTHSGTITLDNGSVTKTVTVQGTTTKRQQAIHWNNELSATNFTMNEEDELSGVAIATADNEEAVLTYSSSDSDVITVSEDGTTLYAVGKGVSNITVYAEGNDIYSPATDTKQFTVTADKKQFIIWEQNLLSLKTNATPNTIALTATATSGGEVSYELEEGSSDCVTLSGKNNATLTITGKTGEVYIIATQAGGEINGEKWIKATYRKQIKVRDPNSSCDEYALADQSFSFSKGDKTTMASKEFTLVGKPTTLTFTGKCGSLKYLWSEREPIYVEQYANFGSGLEWKQVATVTLETSNKNYGPYTLNETATKIRFRSGEYAEQDVTNISIPRKKELIVSEDYISEDAERNVRWSRTISVSRSNIDVVDISVISDDEACQFGVSKTAIGSDCADMTTETFEVFITPREKNATYTGSVTITDGKDSPTQHTINLSITAVAFHQTITDFVLPETALTTDDISVSAKATSGLEVVYLSSDSTIAYVENNRLVILTAGSVSITAYQAGDDRYESVSDTKTIVIELTPVTISEVPQAGSIVVGESLADARLTGGVASVDGSFAWKDPTIVPDETGTQAYTVIFTPENTAYYATAEVQVEVTVVQEKHSQTITWEDEIPQLYAGQSFQLTATASSGLDVLFVSSDETVAYINDENVLVTLSAGAITITATQDGNDFYNAAEPIIREITISKPPTTYSTYESVFCEGDSVEYRGVWYFADTQDSILLEEKNMLGGDSVILLTLTTNPVYLTEDNMTTRVGLSDTWQGIAVSELPVGDTTLIVHYASINGCDSAHVLHLTVEPMIITYGNDTVRLCSGERYVYEGKTYRRSMVDSVRVSERNQFGGDSIVELVVIVSPVMRLTASKTIEQGDEVMWQQYDLSEMPVGDTTLVASYTSVNGCDSVYALNLTVIEKVNSAVGEISTGSRKTQKVFINGQLYIRKGETLYDLYGRKAE